MAPALYNDGFKFLVNIDISRVAVAHMRSMYRDTNSHMLFIVADACATAWPDEFVDVLIDKGTLQSLLLLCDGVSRVAAFAREMWRLLRPGGKMIQIMAGRGMQTYLNLPDLAWSIKHKVVPRKGPGGVANVYIFTKPFSAGGPSYTPSSEPQRQHSTCEKRSTNISNCEIRNTSCDAARRPATAPAGPATWSHPLRLPSFQDTSHRY